MDRQPVVAGQFYPGSTRALDGEVRRFLAAAPAAPDSAPTLLAMVPHAGYIYSGGVAGQTLGQARLADTLLLFGPNHTGLGRSLAVWPEGRWLTPLGPMAVDQKLAADLLAGDTRLAADFSAHLQEHSLEVVVPFLQALNPKAAMVPVAVSERSPQVLEAVARNMAAAVKAAGRPVSIVVSSDMSHYVTHEQAEERDRMAIAPMLDLDPLRLYEVVRRHGISMCGVLPMTLGLFLARELGAASARLAAYATSGQASGDYRRVVGYAGVLVN
ncbi:MAG: AmmeMemoRadiSam system protein B [Thermodesulfobacteriota bacterium]